MRWGWLAGGILLSIAGWLIWLLPAKVVLQPIASLQLGQHQLQLTDIQGRFWDGSAQWSVAGGSAGSGQKGSLGWSWGWQLVQPTISVVMTGDVQLMAAARLGWKKLHIDRLDGMLETAPWAPLVVPGSSLTGSLSLQAVSLTLRQGAAPELQAGHLFFSGGSGRYGRESADLPALWGSVHPEADGSSIRVRNEQDVDVADASLTPERLSIRLYRSWAQMLGVSQGGLPSDVIFQTSFTF